MTQRILENFFADEDECAEAHQRPPARVAALLAHSTGTLLGPFISSDNHDVLAI